MSPRYDLTVRSEEPIPEDVLVEHVAVALRDFKFTGKVDVQVARQHPFDGPEVFDDYFTPKPPTTGTASSGGYTGSTWNEGTFLPLSDGSILPFPDEETRARYIENVNKISEVLKHTHRADLTCHGGVHAEDMVLEPYPNVTEAAMQLREDRDRGGA